MLQRWRVTSNGLTTAAEMLTWRRNMPVKTVCFSLHKRGYCEDNSFSVQQRIDKLKLTRKELYPSNFKVTCDVATILEKYSYLEKGEVVSSDQETSIAGMISNVRSAGKKIKFIDLINNGDKIQLKVHAEHFSSLEQFNQQIDSLRRGDRIGAVGNPCKTKTGELSIDCCQVELLAPSLRIMPLKLESGQKKLQRRYVDILTNSHLRSTLVTRAKIIQHFRAFLQHRGFLEVETPILANNVGGAAAEPFLTHHNEMNMSLYMRVAPELYLKQLIIAGFDRVFEIGKLFRNEGVDPSHNPEFTSCEFYQAHATYTDLMKLTNQLFSSLVQDLKLEPTLSNGTKIDFTTEYKQIEFLPSLEQALNKDLPTPDQLNNQDDSLRYLLEICKSIDLSVRPPFTVPRILDKLFSHLIEPSLVQPTFVTKHPMVMSPLAKPDPESPHLAQRFELFVAGLELCNAYTELNDPQIQRSTLAQQACLSDAESMLPDEDYCTALEYGLPPTAGWGCGIDRLTAILTNNTSIKDTITFPLTKSSH